MNRQIFLSCLKNGQKAFFFFFFFFNLFQLLTNKSKRITGELWSDDKNWNAQPQTRDKVKKRRRKGERERKGKTKTNVMKRQKILLQCL